MGIEFFQVGGSGPKSGVGVETKGVGVETKIVINPDGSQVIVRKSPKRVSKLELDSSGKVDKHQVTEIV